jgi:5-methylthioadenosine/S-adenosylhomocysteine deaminase
MPRVDLLVTAPHALTMSGDGVGYRSQLGIAVDRGRIVALGRAPELRSDYTAEKTISAEHHVLLPGFVDVHMHTAMCLLRGLAQDTRQWMMYGLGRFPHS